MKYYQKNYQSKFRNIYKVNIYIYIPKEKGVRNPWGSTSGAKKITAERNSEIKEKFLNGTTKENLAEMYCLSIASIKKIIYSN